MGMKCIGNEGVSDWLYSIQLESPHVSRDLDAGYLNININHIYGSMTTGLPSLLSEVSNT
jgi:hypothetical protein